MERYAGQNFVLSGSVCDGCLLPVDLFCQINVFADDQRDRLVVNNAVFSGPSGIQRDLDQFADGMNKWIGSQQE